VNEVPAHLEDDYSVFFAAIGSQNLEIVRALSLAPTFELRQLNRKNKMGLTPMAYAGMLEVSQDILDEVMELNLKARREGCASAEEFALMQAEGHKIAELCRQMQLQDNPFAQVLHRLFIEAGMGCSYHHREHFLRITDLEDVHSFTTPSMILHKLVKYAQDPAEMKKFLAILDRPAFNVDVNTHFYNGFTLMGLACTAGNLELVQELLKRGASVHRVHRVRNGSQNALQCAAGGSHSHLVKYLLDTKLLDVNDLNLMGQGALICAGLVSDSTWALEMTRLILKQPDFDKDAHIELRLGRTPLHIAAWQGFVDVAKELITVAKYDVDARVVSEAELEVPWDGFTALHFAAEAGHSPMVRLLLKFGADCTIKDSKGRTPLEVAMAQDASAAILAMLK
jgi:ankyrin repeat protein